MKSGYRIFLAAILILGIAGFFSSSFAKEAPKKSSTQPKKTEKKAPINSKNKKIAMPLTMEIVEKGNKFYLKLNREVKGLWLGKKRKGVKSIGEGRLIEVTPYLSKAKGRKLTFVVLDKAGNEHAKELPVSKYKKLVKVEKPKSKEKKRSAKTGKEEPKKDARTISPRPMVKQSAKPLALMPDLKIEGLKYKVDRSLSNQAGKKQETKPSIIFLVKNIGKGEISLRDFNNISFSVKIGGRLDPRYKKLSHLVSYNKIKDPKGKKLCVIPAELEGRTQVELEVNGNRAIDEVRRDNNRVSILLGSPFLPKGPESNKKMSKTLEKNIPQLGGGVKPLLPPDLIVVETLVDKLCFMKIKVKNNGGPINSVDHAAAKIHLSAGPGLISRVTKLIQIDPDGKLRKSGGEVGEVTYTTNLRITDKNQATLVWLDTEHHITESNETNNGDDALLTCKTSLVWCCARGKVGQTTKAECSTVGRTIHKTENEAIKACGGDISLRPLKKETAGAEIETQQKSKGKLPSAKLTGSMLQLNTDNRIERDTKPAVDYHPPSKKKAAGPKLLKSVMRSFEISIPSDLSHSSNYKIIGYHSEHPGSFIGSSEPFTIRPLIGAKLGKIKKLDQSQQADRMLTETQTTMDRIEPGPTATLESRAPSRPGLDFPAEITSINCPIAVGSSLSIHGRDFGRNEGHVDIALPDATFPCDIFEWGDEHVRCTVPISMGETIGQSGKEAVIWLKPARIDPPDPGTARLPGRGGSSETPYYYSGEEGPRYICAIEPMVPDIDRLSRTDISPLQEITIHGSKFGEASGEVTFNVPGDSYPYAIDIISWSNSRIRIQLSDTTADPYGDTTDRLYSGEDRAAEITVTNRSGNSDSADINFIPGEEGDYPEVDLHTSNVRVTRRTVSGQRQVLIQITVENEEWGSTWRRIRIDLDGLDMAGWIEGGIGGHQEKIYTFVYNDSHVGDALDFYIILDQYNNIPETSTSNNECHVNWRAIDTEREYSCITM